MCMFIRKKSVYAFEGFEAIATLFKITYPVSERVAFCSVAAELEADSACFRKFLYDVI